LGVLESLGRGLLGTTLRFDYEVRNEKQYFYPYSFVRAAART